MAGCCGHSNTFAGPINAGDFVIGDYQVHKDCSTTDRQTDRQTEESGGQGRREGHFYMGAKRASLLRRFPGFARSSFW
jgi:hypothetical protein